MLIHLDKILFLCFALGILLLYRNTQILLGRKLIVLSAIVFLCVYILPLGKWGVTFLENRVEKVSALPDDLSGAIYLSGALDYRLSAVRQEPAFTPAAGRLIGFLKLAHENPDLQLVFSGGAGDQEGWTESEIIQHMTRAFGIDQDRIRYEGKSKNTYQNALFTTQLIHPQPNEKWLLVTSATHMPRAYNLFKSMGWNVIPYPVDYHTTGEYKPHPYPLLFQGLEAWTFFMWEMAGHIHNYITGKTRVFMESYKSEG